MNGAFGPGDLYAAGYLAILQVKMMNRTLKREEWADLKFLLRYRCQAQWEEIARHLVRSAEFRTLQMRATLKTPDTPLHELPKFGDELRPGIRGKKAIPAWFRQLMLGSGY